MREAESNLRGAAGCSSRRNHFAFFALPCIRISVRFKNTLKGRMLKTYIDIFTSVPRSWL